MKKVSVKISLFISLFLWPLLFASLFAGEQMFSGVVKDVYFDNSTKKAVGKLMPTNPVEVLNKKGKLFEVKISGYLEGNNSRAIYFAPGKRIFVTILNKNSGVTLEKGEKIDVDGKSWQKASFVAYISKDGLKTDVTSIFQAASDLFYGNCAQCHSIPDVKKFTANQWPNIVKTKRRLTPLTDEQVKLIELYLQKNAKDM